MDNEEIVEKQKLKKIKLTRVIPMAYERKLKMCEYLIGSSLPVKASKIIQRIRNIERQIMQQVGPGRQYIQMNGQTQIKGNIIEKDQGQMVGGLRKQIQKLFLKRIRNQQGKIQVIICKQRSEFKNLYIQKLNQLKLIDSYFIKMLPSEPPLTKDQYQEWSKMWPINFIYQQIAKQIVHQPSQLQFIQSLSESTDSTDTIYLIDEKLNKVLISENGKCKEGTISHAVMRLLSKWPQSEQFKKSPQKYYYLTNLKLFTRQEICGMCAMALVHSRLKSIYMKFRPNEVMDQIMGNKKLNHQINMFTIQY